MKRGGKTFICLLGGIALAMGAKAITGNPTSMPHPDAAPAPAAANASNNPGDGANPYETIVSRNVFDLREPVVKPETNAPPEPPANVKLTGIMTIFGKKQALFMVQKGTKPGAKQGEQPASYILSEGQREGGLEVVEINPPEKKVTIKSDGIVSTVTFDKAPPPAGHQDMTPGQPHMGRAGGFTPNIPPNGGAPIPERTVRMPNAASYNPQQNGANPGYNPASYNPAQNNGYLGGGYNVGNQGQQPPPTSPEEQIAGLLANQQAHAGDPRYPPMPPLPGVPGMQNPGEQQQQQQQQQQPNTPQYPPIGIHTTGNFKMPPAPP